MRNKANVTVITYSRPTLSRFTVSMERKNDIPKLEKLLKKAIPFEDFPLYKVNDGSVANMDMLPDPPINMANELKHIGYDSSKEPKFDAKVHLELEIPSEVSHFDGDDFVTENQLYKVTPSSSGSQYAYSSTFRVFSKVGTKIAREILVDLSQFWIKIFNL